MARPLLALASLCWLLCGLGGPAHARSDASEAKRLFAQGNRAFDEARYSDALAAYRESFRLVPRPSTIFNIAVSRDRLGDLEGAYVDYQRFLSSATPEGDQVATAKARSDELHGSLRLPVDITSTPPGALVLVDADQALQARTPATLRLALGTHQLRFQADRFRGAERTIEVVAGAPQAVDVKLEPLGELEISADPVDASITIAGRDPSGRGRLSIDVEPGKYHVTVARDGYLAQTLDLEVLAGGAAVRHVVLDRIPTPAPVPPAPPKLVRRGGRGLRLAGLIVGGVGVAVLAVGIEQGLSARGNSGDAQRSALINHEFNAGAYDAATSAQTRMEWLTVSGGLAIAGGAVLYLVGRSQAHDEPESSLAVTPGLSRNAASLTLRGAF